jgi:hypothetical protein
MTVGQIKIEALRLMFAADLDPLISPKNIADHETDGQYGDYLTAMTGSINRAINDIVSRRILPEEALEIPAGTGSTRYGNRRINLSEYPYIYDVSRVIAESDRGYDGAHPFRMEGRTVLLLGADAEEKYTLLYYPRVKAVETWENERELEIPDEIASVIPYFVKGELYRQDEAGDASEAMSWYEQRIAALSPYSTGTQTHVASVYSQVLM